MLFTPTTTSHMGCTNVFVYTWMACVILFATKSGRVYRLIETLERIGGLD